MESSDVERIIDYTKQNKKGVTVGTKKHSGIPRKAQMAGAVIAGATIANTVIGDAKDAIQHDDSGGAITNFILQADAAKQVKDTEIEEKQTGQEFFDTVFDDLNDSQRLEARQKVDYFKDILIQSKKELKEDYEEIFKMIFQKYGDQIKQTAQKYGISEETIYGIIFTESRGDENAYNKVTEATGLMQFLSGTAEVVGLNDPTNPDESIDAAGKYLQQLKNQFGGDEGIAIWAYHAGPGNVYNAFQVYIRDVYHEDIGCYTYAFEAEDDVVVKNIESKTIEYIKKHKIGVADLLFNEAVKKEIVPKLSDKSEEYPFKVLSAVQLWKELKGLNTELANKNVAPSTTLADGTRVTIGSSPTSQQVVHNNQAPR